MFGPRGRKTWCAETVIDSDTPEKLLRVQLDDQRFVDVGRQVGAVGDRLEHAAELLGIDLAPARGQVHLRREVQGLGDVEVLLGLLGQLDRITGLDLVGRQVDGLAVHQHALVRNELTSLRTGDRETHAVDDVVQALLEHLQQRLTGVALATGSLGVIAAELALQQAVDTLDLLLLAQLGGVIGQLALAGDRAVLARLLLEFALGIDRARRALEAEVRAFATGEFAGGTGVTCHVSAPCPLDATLLRRTASVVRNGRHVDDVHDLVSDGVQRTHRGLSTRTRALDAHFQRLHAVVERSLAGLLGGDLRRERGRLARTTETGAAGRGPRQRVALAVGDGDDGVVEGSVDVGDAVGDDTLDLLLHFGSWLGHVRPLLLDCFARTLAGTGIGAGALAAQRQAAAVAQAPIAAQVHQALDRDAHFAAEVTLHDVLADFRAQVVDLGLGEVADLGRRIDADGLAQKLRAGTPDAENGLKADPDMLLDWQVDTRDARHEAISENELSAVNRKV